MKDFYNGLGYVRNEAYQAWNRASAFANAKTDEFVKASTRVFFPLTSDRATKAANCRDLGIYESFAGMVGLVAGVVFC